MKDEHLSHHGILGQKWGIRRFQNPDGSYTTEGRKRYGAIDYQRELNKLDKQVVREVYKGEKAGAKLVKLNEKVKRNVANGKMTPKKAQKIMKKAHELSKIYDESTKRSREGESLMWRTIAEANQKGYTINSKQVLRDAKIGRQWLAGGAGELLSMKVSGLTPANGYVYGNQFRVKNTKDGKNPDIRIHTYNKY